MVMTVEKLISLLQKVVTQEATVIISINEKGYINQYPIDNVIVRHDMSTDEVVVIVERKMK
ncbi:MAG TPA: hypothetical protein DEV97_11625 [Lachnospiraceae bacterium]|nr:hypothetical protein [Lachnospiraceae bacterium]